MSGPVVIAVCALFFFSNVGLFLACLFLAHRANIHRLHCEYLTDKVEHRLTGKPPMTTAGQSFPAGGKL